MWRRRTAWSLVVPVVLAVGASLGALSGPGPAGACSMAAMTADFDGTVTAIDGRLVTYRVDRMRQDDPVGAGRLPEPGGRVVVHYDASPRHLLLDGRYRVRGWVYRSEGVASQIAYNFHSDCCTGAGTTALDGSYLSSSSRGVDSWWPYAVGGLVMVGGALLGLHVLVARRQDRPLR